MVTLAILFVAWIGWTVWRGSSLGRGKLAADGNLLVVAAAIVAVLMAVRGRPDIAAAIVVLTGFAAALPGVARKLKRDFDGRGAGWRKADDAAGGPWPGGARFGERQSRTGAMSQQEAYQVLGLAPGAGAQAVTEAYRRLMKESHPDRGGSHERAARLNLARQVLEGGHG